MERFRFKKVCAFILALAMMVSQLGVQGVTVYAAQKTIKSVSIKIGSKNVTKKTVRMTKGSSKMMKVVVKPAASKKSVAFRSGNKKVVQVSKKGKLTAKKAGTAKVTVTVRGKNGKKKSTWVKVKVSKPKQETDEPTRNEDDSTPVPSPTSETEPSPVVSSVPEVTVTPEAVATPEASATPEATVTPAITPYNSAVYVPVSNADKKVEVHDSASLQSELSKASLPGTIIYTSDAKEEITLPAGIKADSTSLIVDAPNATITNKAIFKDITIKAIASDTWIEEAVGNQFNIISKATHMRIGSEASVKQISVNDDAQDGVQDIKIENDGIIQGISVSANVTFKLTGANHTRIPFDVAASAAGMVINTTIPLGVETAAAITLQLRFGAEQMTSVSVPNDTIQAIIQGLGIIPVTNRSDNTTQNVVAAPPVGFDVEDENAVPATITGTVNKAVENGAEVLENAHVFVLPYKTGAVLTETTAIIEDAQKDGTCKEAVTSADGKYTIGNLKRGNYILIVKADDLLDYTQTIVLNQDTYQNEDITMVDTSNARGSIGGCLVDAISGNVNVQLLLELRAGAGNTYGDVVASVRSDAETSRYDFTDLPIGTYTIYVKDTNANKVYSDAAFTVTIPPYSPVTKDLTISRVDTHYEGQIQFILNWEKEAEDGSVSSDLDSHLVGPAVGGNGFFHTYFSDREYYVDSERYADLDRDDVDYEGPETTTVRKTVDGVYHFYIHDFANDDARNTKLTTSRPVIRIYAGDRSLGSYVVPDNGVGNVWDVCTYDTRTSTLTLVNKIYYYPEYETLGDITSAKQYLADRIDAVKNMELQDNAKITDLLADAQSLLDTSDDFTKIAGMISRLRGLENAVEIADVNFTGKKGRYSSDSEEGVSIIKLTGTEAVLPDDLKVIPVSEDAVCTLADSDKEAYVKKVVVANSLTGTEQAYYISYTQYIPQLEEISNLTDGDNYISDWYKEGNYIYVYGAAASLGAPVLHFADDNVTSTYQAIENEEAYVGKFTVSYGEHTREYFVKYTQEKVNIKLTGVTEEGNTISDIDYDWVDIGDDEYKVYYVYGSKEKLGNGTAEGVQFKFNVQPADVKITPVTEADSKWDFVLDVTYMDEVQKVYVKYITDKN